MRLPAFSAVFVLLFFAASPLFLAGCGGPVARDNVEYKYPTRNRFGDTVIKDVNAEEEETVFGKGGIDLFNNQRKQRDQQGGGGIGVNSFLWQATLDTLSFMPLSSADPFGGVIITEWYSAPETPSEQFKINAFIMSRSLRANGIRVTPFKRVKTSDGDWRDVAVDPKTKTKLENAILAKARQLRMSMDAAQ